MTLRNSAAFESNFTEQKKGDEEAESSVPWGLEWGGGVKEDKNSQLDGFSG